MSMLDHAPRFSLEEAQAIALDRWGVAVSASPLPSERDQNFLLETWTGERFVLKISNGAEDRALLDAQNRAMERIASTNLCPRLIVSAAGREIETVVAPSGTPHLVRLVTYLPGTPMGKVRRRTPGLLENVGRSVAQVDAALAGFDHPALRRDFHWDLASGLDVVRAGVGRIEDRELAAVIADLEGAFERHTAWRLGDLRRSVIHNDANDFNVLVGGGDEPDRPQPARGGADRPRRHGPQLHRRRPGGGDRVRGPGRGRPAGGREPRRARLPRGLPARGGGACGAVGPCDAAAVHERVHRRGPACAAAPTTPTSGSARRRSGPRSRRSHAFGPGSPRPSSAWRAGCRPRRRARTSRRGWRPTRPTSRRFWVQTCAPRPSWCST